ncbi:metal-dependent hydrolase family protein [Sphingomonas sp. LY160]|uniref:metal-dependent hydrolase family protein n=1 Tax=Sphingomonas sp. LY160 TaxID=3095342 RepID=UPI002ADEF53C|nr:amidohydrolase family protein [Sphingomonas sp. LY160]MEA1071841.1 amidohydrolase family protein [Sphingomonas sp. LY160]
MGISIKRWMAAAAWMAAGPALAAPTYIHADRVIAVPGQPVRGASTIIVDAGRIVSIQNGHLAPPSGATAIDLRGKTVLPGLIDSHVHLSSDRGGEAGLLSFVREEPQMNALEAQMNGMKTLRAGFTTVRNLGDEGATLALREAIKRGWVQGPRIVDAASSISTTGGHMDGRGGLNDDLVAHLPSPENLCDGADDCRKVVRRQIDRGADVIKFATTGGVNSGTGLATRMNEEEAKALVETAHAYGRKVAVHAHGADGIKLALRAGADSIEHGTVMDDEIVRTMKRQGTYYVPTLSTVNGYLERLAADPNAYAPDVKAQIDWRIGITGQSLAKAVPAGVRIAFGTDAGVSKHGRNADEFELLVKYGMTPVEAIKAATVNAADLLGLSREVGTIEPGKSADLIAVTGDPIIDVKILKKVDFVMARGKVVALD